MTKRLLIEFFLVEESAEKPNREIEDEIREEFLAGNAHIPWCREIKKVVVTETEPHPEGFE